MLLLLHPLVDSILFSSIIWHRIKPKSSCMHSILLLFLAMPWLEITNRLRENGLLICCKGWRFCHWEPISTHRQLAEVERGRRNLLRRQPEFESTWQLYSKARRCCDMMRKCWSRAIPQGYTLKLIEMSFNSFINRVTMIWYLIFAQTFGLSKTHLLCFEAYKVETAYWHGRNCWKKTMSFWTILTYDIAPCLRDSVGLQFTRPAMPSFPSPSWPPGDTKNVIGFGFGVLCKEPN